jgi:glyoxylase I family protein
VKLCTAPARVLLPRLITTWRHASTGSDDPDTIIDNAGGSHLWIERFLVRHEVPTVTLVGSCFAVDGSVHPFTDAKDPAVAIPSTGYAHIRLTVTDIVRSRTFYDAIFGFPVAYELPPEADEATREAMSFLFGGVIYAFGGCLLGLRPVAPADHVSFSVPGRSDLEAAAAALDAIGAPHSGVKDIGAALLLEFRDPDNIALELFAPAG